MKIKSLVLSLLLGSATGVSATPVLFSMQSLTGATINRQIQVTPDTSQNPLVFGTNLVSSAPFYLQPVNGQVLTNLVPWGYTILVQGWPRTAHIVVPQDTNTWNAAALINTNAFAPLTIYTGGINNGGTNSTLWNGLQTNVLLGVTTPQSFMLTYLDANSNLNYSMAKWTPATGTLTILGADGVSSVVTLGTNGGVSALSYAGLALASQSTNGIITTNDLATARIIQNYNGIQKPLLGFETWVLTQGDTNSTFNEKGLLGVMTNYINYGYAASGYNAFLIDEGWSTNRDGSGNLVSSGAFPSGIPWFISNLHSNGWKAGLFFTLGNTGFPNSAPQIGSANNLIQDATNAANWGVDFVYLVVDDNSPNYNMSNGYVPNYWKYKTFINALQSTGRKISVYGTTHKWEPWIQGAMDASLYADYAGYVDFNQTWQAILNMNDGFQQQRNFCQPGHYIMSGWPSYAQDGSGNNSTNATAAYYGLLALWHSPILATRAYGEIAGLTFNGSITFASVAAIQTNALMLSIDQDALASPPQVIASNNFVQTLYEPLSGNQYAIGLLNRDTGSTAKTVALSWTNLAAFPANPPIPGGSYILQDVFNGTNSLVTTNGLGYVLGSNTLALFILTPTNTGIISGNGVSLATVSNAMASGSNFLAGTSIAAGIANPNPASPFAYTAGFSSGANGFLYYTQPGTLGLSGSGGLFVCLDSTGTIYEPIQFYGNGYNFLNGAVTVTPKATAFTNAFQIVPTNAATVGIGVHSDNNGTNWVVPGVLAVSNSIVGAGFISSVNQQVTNDCVQPVTITLSQTAGPMVSTNGAIFTVSFNAGALTNIPFASLVSAATNYVAGNFKPPIAGSINYAVSNNAIYAITDHSTNKILSLGN